MDVYEQREDIGGVLLPAAAPNFKEELRRMIPWWRTQLDALDTVTVHVGEAIAADDPRLAEADEVIVAAGSQPLMPASIPGIERAIDVLAFHEGAEVGHRVVMCGGGLSGADAALELAEAGHEVVIVEMADEIARDMLMLNRISLLRNLAEAGVRILTGTTVTAIGGDGVHVEGHDGASVLEADTVIAAFGCRPATGLAEELAAQGISARTVGDCVSPRTVGDAVNDAYELALAL